MGEPSVRHKCKKSGSIIQILTPRTALPLTWPTMERVERKTYRCGVGKQKNWSGRDWAARKAEKSNYLDVIKESSQRKTRTSVETLNLTNTPGNKQSGFLKNLKELFFSSFLYLYICIVFILPSVSVF